MNRRSIAVKTMTAGACGLMALATISAIPLAATAPAAKGSLCVSGETPIFSCAIGAKYASICQSATQATYRYGRPGKIELTSHTMTFAQRGYSGGGETQITVSNGAYSYIAYDRMVRTGFGEDGLHYPAMTNGVIVRRAGKIIASKSCSNDSPVLSRAIEIIPNGPFVDH